jgi:formyl-CoA transferase
MQHRDELLRMIGDIMKRQTRAHWSGRLDALGVPNGPLNTVPEVMALAQVAALSMFSKPYADAPTLFHGLPISFDGQRAGDASRAPAIGEHDGLA